jgi:hypothetical protein
MAVHIKMWLVLVIIHVALSRHVESGQLDFSFLLSFYAPLRLAVKLWISIPYLQPVTKLSRRSSCNCCWLDSLSYGEPTNGKERQDMCPTWTASLFQPRPPHFLSSVVTRLGQLPRHDVSMASLPASPYKRLIRLVLAPH